jgi:hypothetical protein
MHGSGDGQCSNELGAECSVDVTVTTYACGSTGVSVVGYNTQLLGIILLGIIPNHKPNFSFIIARLSIIPNPLGRGICNPNHWV